MRKVKKTQHHDEERINLLKLYNILDTPQEKEFDSLLQIANTICNTSMAYISFFDTDRHFLKSKIGLDESQIPKAAEFYSQMVLSPNTIFEVTNLKEDNRLPKNSLPSKLKATFFAAAPLNIVEGCTVGCLSVMDKKSLQLTEAQKASLQLIANQTIALLELKKQNSQLKEENKTVHKLNNRLHYFSSRLTHDLKSPVNNINFLLDVLQKDYFEIFKESEAKEFIDLITNRVHYMENLIEDMLEYSTVTSKDMSYSAFNLNELLDHILSNIDVRNEVVLQCNFENLMLYSSKIAFLIIFQNLISNSKKYSDEKAVVIEIDFNESELSYHFTYKDNGPGIPKEYWGKVFEMFETLGSNRDSTGIGLSTIRSSLERLGGNIHLSERTDNNKGVCFNFYVEKKV